MKKKEHHLNIGGASILLLLVVFAMTVFAVLSMGASLQELKLAEKTRDSVKNYYIADSASEEMLKTYNEIKHKSILQSEVAPIEYFYNEIGNLKNTTFDPSSLILTCHISVDYNINLETKLYVPSDLKGPFEVLSQKMIPVEDDYESGEIEIWDAEIPE